MKIFLLVATVALTQARPDIGINYLPPGGGFQKTTYQQGGGGGFTTGSGGIGGSGGFKSAGGNFGGGGGYSGGTGSGSSSSFHTAGGFGGSSGSSAGFGGGHGGQQEVTNTVYFYDAPQDEIIQAASIKIDGGAGSHHNRVVFIKAPGYQTQQITDIAGNVGGSGEKTKIYVLAKRPDAQQDVIINTASHSSVAKPEVFYIKYNTQQDAEEQILGSLNGQGGNAAQSVESDHAFVQSIRDSIDVRSQGPIIHNIGGGGGSQVEPGAQILGLSGASFTNGQRAGGGASGTASQVSTGSSSFQTSGGFVSKTSGGGGYTGGSVGGNEPYNYPRPN